MGHELLLSRVGAHGFVAERFLGCLREGFPDFFTPLTAFLIHSYLRLLGYM